MRNALESRRSLLLLNEVTRKSRLLDFHCSLKGKQALFAFVSWWFVVEDKEEAKEANRACLTRSTGEEDRKKGRVT